MNYVRRIGLGKLSRVFIALQMRSLSHTVALECVPCISYISFQYYVFRCQYFSLINDYVGMDCATVILLDIINDKIANKKYGN